jgi:ribosomal protein L7/L12
MTDPDRKALEDEILRLLAGSRKIEAIKLCRERMGLGLKEAKDLVDGLEAGRRGAPPPAAPGDADLLDLVRAGRKIEAVKLCRERTGLGLKEAKDAVDALAAAHGVVAPARGCLALLVPFLFH